MATQIILDGTLQFMSWMVVGICLIFGFCALMGFVYFVIAMVRLKREKGGAVDGPHRGTIGDGQL